MVAFNPNGISYARWLVKLESAYKSLAATANIPEEEDQELHFRTRAQYAARRLYDDVVATYPSTVFENVNVAQNVLRVFPAMENAIISDELGLEDLSQFASDMTDAASALHTAVHEAYPEGINP